MRDGGIARTAASSREKIVAGGEGHPIFSLLLPFDLLPGLLLTDFNQKTEVKGM